MITATTALCTLPEYIFFEGGATANLMQLINEFENCRLTFHQAEKNRQPAVFKALLGVSGSPRRVLSCR
ncbi:hypothetical protein N5F23_21065 [Pseudomonas sichuanensis]|uniref:hypothetical protein n=1 Tax=Pseudomonas sichuanensis TaxID=2213015 RepID=UPI00244A11B5|nr:hypothetical protein [Pseudomonas sichuanensis]MDH0733206.1 hypothetical protein [Pseudomonas sichuanensis]MDH1585080.1 hypothetical protein [Pseudomonas sichuanensis]MDH1594507.1 hypothetical protein [Pseudomonas sichuanensis]MDH1600241.1 hypothetical protein [Pseudomonas sichuanensis]